MHIGFILTKTPAEEGFQTFLKFINIYLGKEDLSIYLTGNGVYCAIEGYNESLKIHRILRKTKIYAYADDLDARGIKKKQLIPGIKIFENYETLVVALMEEMDQILSF
ncbi:MAG: DsrH like protein [Methanobacterium sp. PtaU1.Bin242]|nr:MAG: DsrH like protein [Methanobacterium sp. PtaU1.Bin242]